MARSLSADLCKRLARLLPLLSSDQPGEVSATAAAITRALKLAERDWHDLVASSPAPAVPAAASPAQATPPPGGARVKPSTASMWLSWSATSAPRGCYLSDNAKGFLDSLEERAGRYRLVLLQREAVGVVCRIAGAGQRRLRGDMKRPGRTPASLFTQPASASASSTPRPAPRREARPRRRPAAARLRPPRSAPARMSSAGQ